MKNLPRKVYNALRHPDKAIRKAKVKLGLAGPNPITVPSLLREPNVGGPRLVQIMNYNHATKGVDYQGNAGDWFLITTLRDLFNAQAGPLRWDSLHIHRFVGESELRFLNRSDGIVIGGGGMLLKDTNPNPYSDWQWSCSVEALRKIKVPIAMFAVGYNRFRNQPDFAPVFSEHLTLLAEKAVYLGLRNSASVQSVKGYLPEELHSKVRFQPCMTTLASKLYPWAIDQSHPEPQFIALNCAFDRPQYRFGETQERILEHVAEAAWRLSRHLPIKFYAHVENDQLVLPYLDKRGVPYEVVPLHNASASAVLEAYAEPMLSVGMRGHSQLIAMGCKRPFLSLYAHPKLRYLLEDIDALDWGVDLQSPDLADVISASAFKILDNHNAVIDRITHAQDRFWETTLINLSDLAEGFGLASSPKLALAHSGN